MTRFYGGKICSESNAPSKMVMKKTGKWQRSKANRKLTGEGDIYGREK